MSLLSSVRRPCSAAEKGRGFKTPFERDDVNGNGRVSRKEFGGPPRAFNMPDRDGDGFITRQEAIKAGSVGRRDRGFPRTMRLRDSQSVSTRPPETRNMVNIYAGGKHRRALVCRPDGSKPFPAVIYNHGMIVDLKGYREAVKQGYDIDGICETLAGEGFMVFVLIRESGKGNFPGHKAEVSWMIDYVKASSEVDPSRIVVMGFSRGGTLTLSAGVVRKDLRALIIMAPAPVRGEFAKEVQKVKNINVPVLLLVEADDKLLILEDYDTLKNSLRLYEKMYVRLDMTKAVDTGSSGKSVTIGMM